MLEQRLAFVGQRDGLRTGRAMDETMADDPLERCDLLADRGLNVPKRTRGPAERRLLRDRHERGEMPKLDAEPFVADGASILTHGLDRNAGRSAIKDFEDV